jgi:hypothetical protein
MPARLVCAVVGSLVSVACAIADPAIADTTGESATSDSSTADTALDATDVGESSTSTSTSSSDGPADATETGPSSGSLRGGVQKGPLLLGSSLRASPLDAHGEPTGDVIAGQLDDDRGRFDLGDVAAGIYLLEADGFHYDEVRGDLSGAPIVLRAVVVIPTTDDVYVNAFTHLAHRRVLALLDTGVAIDDALAQAEQELAAALPIGPAAAPAPASGAEMTLLDGDDAAARYLFATSAVIGQAATLAAGGLGSDAYLQQLLNHGAAELGEAGAFEPGTSDALIAGLLALDVATVEANLAARMTELGIDAATPQLDPVLDQDRDGVMNDLDVCDVVVDPEQLDSDGDGLGDACDPYPMGEPELLAGAIELPWSFAVTPTWIYYSSLGAPGVDDGGLWRVATDGGVAELVDASVGPWDVAASSTAALWGHLAGISQASFDGEVDALLPMTTARAVVVDASRILWVNEQGVYASPLDAPAPELLVTGNGWAYEAAANDDTLYWTTSTTVEAVRKDGSESWTVADGMTYSAGVVADADDVFWLDVGTCTIHRAPADGGVVSEVWASDDANDFGHVCTAGTSQIALDDTHVYWGGQDVLSRVARDGGEREEIAGGDSVWYVRDVHVDGVHVYWLNHTSVWEKDMGLGTVMRMTKPA